MATTATDDYRRANKIGANISNDGSLSMAEHSFSGTVSHILVVNAYLLQDMFPDDDTVRMVQKDVDDHIDQSIRNIADLMRTTTKPESTTADAASADTTTTTAVTEEKVDKTVKTENVVASLLKMPTKRKGVRRSVGATAVQEGILTQEMLDAIKKEIRDELKKRKQNIMFVPFFVARSYTK